MSAPRTITDGSNNEVSSNSSHIANINPIRYRGYYYDIDTGFYYLQSRYYDPVTGRFVNADILFDDGAGLLGYNLFAYCANNPVMRSDPTGELSILAAFLIGIATCAVVSGGIDLGTQVIIGNDINWRSVGASALAGGLVGGLMAIPGAQGVSLGLGQTMAWGAVSSGLGYGVYNVVNDSTPSFIGYARSMTFGGLFSGVFSTLTRGYVPPYKSQGSTGRTVANNLKEQLAMEQVLSNPLKGAKKISNLVLQDSRWPSWDGWAKYSNTVNGVEIHFNYNSRMGVFDDFKFK